MTSRGFTFFRASPRLVRVHLQIGQLVNGRAGLFVLALACLLILSMLPCLQDPVSAGQYGDVKILVVTVDDDSGRIPDTSGPVPGAEINLAPAHLLNSVIRTDTTFTRTLRTDSSGRAVFMGVPPGQYEAVVEVSGFDMERRLLRVRANRTSDPVIGVHLISIFTDHGMFVPLEDSALDGKRPGLVLDYDEFSRLPLP